MDSSSGCGPIGKTQLLCPKISVLSFKSQRYLTMIFQPWGARRSKIKGRLSNSFIKRFFKGRVISTAVRYSQWRLLIYKDYTTYWKWGSTSANKAGAYHIYRNKKCYYISALWRRVPNARIEECVTQYLHECSHRMNLLENQIWDYGWMKERIIWQRRCIQK